MHCGFETEQDIGNRFDSDNSPTPPPHFSQKCSNSAKFGLILAFEPRCRLYVLSKFCI